MTLPREPEVEPAKIDLSTLPVEIQREVYSYLVTPWSLRIISDRRNLLYTEAILSSDPRNWVSPDNTPGHKLASTCRVIREIVSVLQHQAFDGYLCVDQIFENGPDWLFNPWLAHVHSLYYIACIRIQPRSFGFRMKLKNAVVRTKQFASTYIRLMSKLKYARCILIEHESHAHPMLTASKLFRRVPLRTLEDVEREAGYQLSDLVQHSRSSTNPHGIEKADFQFFQFWNGWHKGTCKSNGMEIMVSRQNETFKTLDIAVNETGGDFYLWKEANSWQVLVYIIGPDAFNRPFGDVPTEFQWFVSLARDVARDFRKEMERDHAELDDEEADD